MGDSGVKSGSNLKMLPAVVVIIAACLVAGCGSSASLPELFAKQAPEAQHVAASGPVWSQVAMSPISGAPAVYGKLLMQELDQRAQAGSIALLINPTAPAETRLEGSLVLSRDRGKDGLSSLTYAWKVFDAKGALVENIEGQEPVKLPLIANDPWAWIAPTVTAAIADRAMTALRSHVRTAAPAAAAQ